MSDIQKRKIFWLLSIVALMIFLLAVSLPGLQFQQGEVFPLLFAGSGGSGEVQPPVLPSGTYRLLQGLLAFLFILLIVHIVISLFDKAFRNRLLMNILLIASLLLLMSWLEETDQLPELGALQPPPEENLDFQDTGIDQTLSIPPEVVPQPWMLGLTIFGIAAVVAVVAFFGFRIFSRQIASHDSPLDELGSQAQAALDEIEKAEFAFSDVIIRCYFEMSQTIQEANGIRRGQAMTTKEFGKVLLSRGFPGRPVRQLTDLFEQVRYGRRSVEPEKKQVAVESLTEIVQYCRGKT